MKHRIGLSVPVEDTSVHLMVEYQDDHKELRNFKVWQNKLSRNWALYSNGELEISSDDYISYIKLWNSAFEYLAEFDQYNIFDSRKLIIGGGDLQVANLLSLNHTGNWRIRVVDPCAVHIQVLLGQFLPHVIDLSEVDLWAHTYKEYCDRRAPGGPAYQLICIDLSDDYLDIADSFYKPETMTNLYEQLDDYGYLVAYMANGSLDLGSKFTLEKEFQTDIPGYSDKPTRVGIFKKVLYEESEGSS